MLATIARGYPEVASTRRGQHDYAEAVASIHSASRIFTVAVRLTEREARAHGAR